MWVWLLGMLPVLFCLLIMLLGVWLFAAGPIGQLLEQLNGPISQIQLSIPRPAWYHLLLILLPLPAAVLLKPLHSLAVAAWVHQVWERRAAPASPDGDAVSAPESRED